MLFVAALLLISVAYASLSPHDAATDSVYASNNCDAEVEQAKAQRSWLIGTLVGSFCAIVFLSVLYKKERDEEKRLEDLVKKRTQELNEQNKLLESLSMTDQLTDVPNRRSFDARMKHEWRIAMREKTPISILMMDIDNFKTYNDNYGHQQGDAVLQIVAKAIEKEAKRPGDFSARWGGEEFAVLLSNTNAKGALVVAETIRSSIEDLKISLLADGSITKVTVSIGVHTLTSVQNVSSDYFISGADEALYKAKKLGRNRVFTYNT